MSDPFDGKNNNKRSDRTPRIIFANLRRSNEPILTEDQYKVFSATTFVGWALVIVIFWKFRIDISLSQDLLTSIAEASVGLSALSLAVLSILHELNKRDRWFKLGLFLVSILFASVVCCGYFLALTWQPAFAAPQQVTIVVVALLGIVAVLQIDWAAIFGSRKISSDSIESRLLRLSLALRPVRLVAAFVPPIFLIWFPGLNRLTAVVVLFVGASLALVVLMTVTTLFLFKRQDQTEHEDPFMAALRARFENETRSLIRFGELKVKAADALRQLQRDKLTDVESDANTAPSMIELSYVVDRLRQMGITDDRHLLDDVLTSLISDGTLCRENYDGPYWLVPDDQVVQMSASVLGRLVMVISDNGSGPNYRSDFTVEGYRFTKFRDWIANEVKVPPYVVGAYLVPRLLKRLLNEDEFGVLRSGSNQIFVNRRIGISLAQWHQVVTEVEEAAKESCERVRKNGYSYGPNTMNEYIWYHLGQKLLHTDDGYIKSISDEELAILGSIVTAQSGTLN